MGQTASALVKQSVFIPKPHFTVDDIPDLSGKVIIVTGGNAGIGKETVKVLLTKNAKVYLAARNKTKADETIAELKRDTGKEPVFLELDLADLKSVRKAAQNFQSQESRLDVLFNNGGVMIPPVDNLTADGYDLQFGTNVLGHYFFTILLLPLLIESAKSSPDGKTRVITTSAAAHLFIRDVDYETLRDDTPVEKRKRRKMGTANLYSQSKFGNVVFSNELARRYGDGDQGILSLSLNPGLIRSELTRQLPSLVRKIHASIMLHPTSLGAITQLWAGTSPEVVDMTGKYLIPWAREGSVRPETRDVAVGEKLWAWLEGQVKNV